MEREREGFGVGEERTGASRALFPFPSLSLYTRLFATLHFPHVTNRSLLFALLFRPLSIVAMSMLDAFFNKGAFKGAKCKTLLKLTIPRIKLLRNRREIQLKQMRRDISKLLESGQEATARIRVEHIIREENMMAAQEILELFCELIVVRLPIIETQRECPLDLKEAISSLCFAAPRCSDLSELQQVQMLFAAKYGREFVAAATELMPDCGVNRQIIELLSVRAPSVESKIKLLKEIAAEHEVEWDPAASETEFLKPHEDLLNGPNHLISGSTVVLSKEEPDASVSSASVEASHEQLDSDSDAGFDSLDLPEVPKVSVQPNSDTASSPDITSTTQAALPPDMGFDHELRKSTTSTEEMPQNPGLQSVVGSKSLDAMPSDHPNVSVSARDEQFVPFVASPPSSATFPAMQSETVPPFSEPVPSVATRLSSSLTFSATQHEKISSIPEPVPSLSRTKSEITVDLQDVLAAAQAAAETAERAAAAARLAASLAQIRITELVTKRNNKRSEEEGEYPSGGLNQANLVKDSALREENSFDHSIDGSSKVQTAPSYDMPKLEAVSSGSIGHGFAHQPQRSTSLEDDPYFSYPNLFSRQDSSVRSTGDSPSTH